MEEGGELWAQKQCASKPLMSATQSCAYIMKNPRATCGRPLGIKPLAVIPEKKEVNEKGVVVETLTHSINKRHGGSGRGDKTCQPEVPLWMVFPAGPC
jgi:hypothetical protein